MAYSIKNPGAKDGKNIVRRGISALFLPFGTTAWVRAPGVKNFADNTNRGTQDYTLNEVGIDETLLTDTTSLSRSIAFESSLSEDPDLKRLFYGAAPVQTDATADDTTIDAYIETLDTGINGALILHIQTTKAGAKNKVKFLRKVFLKGDGTGDDNGAETLKYTALQNFVDFTPPVALGDFAGRQARFTLTYEYPQGDTAAFNSIMEALTTLGTVAV